MSHKRMGQASFVEAFLRPDVGANQQPPMDQGKVSERDPDAGFTRRGQRSFFGYKARKSGSGPRPPLATTPQTAPPLVRAPMTSQALPETSQHGPDQALVFRRSRMRRRH